MGEVSFKDYTADAIVLEVKDEKGSASIVVDKFLALHLEDFLYHFIRCSDFPKCGHNTVYQDKSKPTD